MPRAKKEMSTPVAVVLDEFEGRYAPLGVYTVSFETFNKTPTRHRCSSGCQTIAASASTGVSWSRASSPSDGSTTRRRTWPGQHPDGFKIRPELAGRAEEGGLDSQVAGSLEVLFRVVNHQRCIRRQAETVE